MLAVAAQAGTLVTLNTFDTQNRHCIGTTEGTEDAMYVAVDEDTEYPECGSWGFGHGNRYHMAIQFDFSEIAKEQEPGFAFEITGSRLSLDENEGSDYDGEGEIRPILIDWVEGSTPGTWNTLTAKGATGDVVEVGNRSTNKLVRFPLSGAEADTFNQMVEDWLNDDLPNYGMLVVANAITESSWDVFSLEFTFNYDLVPDMRDSDDDGLTNFDELSDGLDPYNPDTDDDGLDDGIEIEMGTDPNASDTDRDGLSDGEEVDAYGTDPLMADTDRDGLPDGLEVDSGSDPNNVDTDGDGIEDGAEGTGDDDLDGIPNVLDAEFNEPPSETAEETTGCSTVGALGTSGWLISGFWLMARRRQS
jgi:hypothetical protein